MCFELAYFTCLFIHVHLPVEEGDARAVVATVFKAFEAFYKNGECFFFANVGYDSTHN